MENDPAHEPEQQNAREGVQEVEPAGTHLALAQSLKTMGEAQHKRHAGWAVVSARAEAFVRAAGIDVTRLLFQPDLRLRDPKHDEDLQVLSCAIGDDFAVKVTTMGKVSHLVRTHKLADMHVAGPVNDAVRAMVAVMMRTVVEDAVGQMVDAGGLPGLPSFDKLHQLSTVVGMTPEALVDQHWERLAAQDNVVGSPQRLITRAQLADAMLDAAVQALGGLPDEQLPKRDTHCWECGAPLEDGLCSKLGDHGLVDLPPRMRPCWEDAPDTEARAKMELLAEPPQSETVHHLQPHPSYTMDGDGRCKPDDPGE